MHSLQTIAAFCCLAGYLPRTMADIASELSSVLAAYPNLSDMRQLVNQDPDIINTVFGDNQNLTILVPTNDAFAAFASAHGQDFTSADAEFVANTLSYHILAGALTDANFNSEIATAVPSLLTGELYNNRSSGTNFETAFGPGANGQVVLIERTSDGFILVQASQGHTNLTALDKEWPGGYIQIVDSIFDLPKNCTGTMGGIDGLGTLTGALKDSGAYESLDTMPNVTCLAPDDEAFQNAGNPQTNFNATQVTWLAR